MKDILIFVIGWAVIISSACFIIKIEDIIKWIKSRNFPKPVRALMYSMIVLIGIIAAIAVIL